MITLRGVLAPPTVFAVFRAEAAKWGAEAVVDVDIDSAARIETYEDTETDAQGNTTPVTRTERVVYAFASGTLVRKAGEGK